MPKARYGYDAPGIMLGMLGGGGGVIGLGLVGLGFSGGGLLALACDAEIVLGCLPFSLGCLMVAYAVAGKGRMREAMMAAVDWSGDECVLDVGAGAGLLLIAAAKRLTTGSAEGVDIWSAKDSAPTRARRPCAISRSRAWPIAPASRRPTPAVFPCLTAV